MPRRRTAAPSQRQLRMGELIRHALSDLFARGALSDPALAGVSLTVTEVRASPDLKNATVFVTPLGGEDMDQIVSALERASGFLRAQVARSIEVRYTPNLQFEADRTFENARRIDDLLNQAVSRTGMSASDGGDGV